MQITICDPNLTDLTVNRLLNYTFWSDPLLWHVQGTNLHTVTDDTSLEGWAAAKIFLANKGLSGVFFFFFFTKHCPKQCPTHYCGCQSIQTTTVHQWQPLFTKAASIVLFCVIVSSPRDSHMALSLPMWLVGFWRANEFCCQMDLQSKSNLPGYIDIMSLKLT